LVLHTSLPHIPPTWYLLRFGASYTHWYLPHPLVQPWYNIHHSYPSHRAFSAAHQRVPLRQPARLLRGAPACTPPPARAPPPRRTSVYPSSSPRASSAAHQRVPAAAPQPLSAAPRRSRPISDAPSRSQLHPPDLSTLDTHLEKPVIENPKPALPPPRLSPHPAPPPGPARLLPARSLAAVALRAAHLLRWRSPVVSRGCHAVPFPRQFAS